MQALVAAWAYSPLRNFARSGLLTVLNRQCHKPVGGAKRKINTAASRDAPIDIIPSDATVTNFCPGIGR
jgi:hypothetical protein